MTGVPTPFSSVEGNTRNGVNASRWGTPRGRRTSACTEPSCARTGRSHPHPPPTVGATGRPGKA